MMKLIIVAVLSLFFLSGCMKVPKTAAYYTYNLDLVGLKQFHENGGDLSSNIVDGNLYHGHALCAAVYHSIDYRSYNFNKKNRAIVDYLLNNGITTQNIQCKVSYYDDRAFNLFNLSLMSHDKEIIKKLINNKVTIHNFNLPRIRVSITNNIWYEDTSTSCGLKQYICDNQKFAQEYFDELQRKKQYDEKQSIEKRNDEEIDKLLGI